MWAQLVMAPAALPAVTQGSWGSATDLPRGELNCREPAQHRGLAPASGRGNLSQEHPANRDIYLGSFSLLSPWSCRELLLPPVHETWVSLREPVNPKVSPWAASCCHQPHKWGIRGVGGSRALLKECLSGHFKVLPLPLGRGRVLFLTAHVAVLGWGAAQSSVSPQLQMWWSGVGWSSPYSPRWTCHTNTRASTPFIPLKSPHQELVAFPSICILEVTRTYRSNTSLN